MKIMFHGGKCCGVKHIFGLGTSPTSLLSPRTGVDKDDDDYEGPYDPTADGDDFRTDGPEWFDEDAPRESHEKRLERYLEFIRKHQPGCLVEVIICTSGTFYNQSAWKPVLEKNGFKEVISWTNSNSGATLTKYCLVFEKGKVKE
jgi:hypothetical protein